MNSERQVMSQESLAGLGGGRIAYVKAMRSEDVRTIFPGAPEMQPGLELWALLAADGTPLMLSDDRDAVFVNAREHDLETVSVH